MTRVLFVCHGNICRSPMAEFVFRAMVQKAGRAQAYEAQRAALSSEELGNPGYPPARAMLARHGISCEGKMCIIDSYRAGERLYSSYYGEVSYYTKKGGVIASEIMLPPHAPEIYLDRATLWNAVGTAVVPFRDLRISDLVEV